MTQFTKKNLSFFLLVAGCWLLVATPAQAAEVFFGANSKEVQVDTKFEVGVFLNAQDQSVNAVEAQIIFPADSFVFEGFLSGNSVITLWIQQPKLISPGVISFSGIMPGGFMSQKGYLFSLIFRAVETGNATIAADQEKVLLDDGEGSETSISKAPLAINIVEKSSSPLFTPLYDPVLPEAFEPQISKDPNVYEEKYFLTFATQDKDSGVDYYEVMESGQFGSFASLLKKRQWVRAESPYLLQDQSLKSVISVKAVDRAGNERLATVNASNGFPWYENYIIWIIILIIIGSLMVIFKKFLWKKK
ncbi:MAG: hypothetical protein A3A98_00930 [Candidatus Staskawiczbacteria bacterium RIFCSPLOWO2_01_FULL_40_39]|uniref:Cohesin domain-containing protein n=1 Tax=Candidatus Staskawiczbacteria bacterium RIFCSPHIGHO2_01_FULL_39_25 TaxID=1802202 RepID=A0A1G2HMX6_9BACT|nr:MAG: hypothetical protein A2730_00930 [Candidatus Staskawiczbacteria bacterium RIFCSPHIGHO2_01_FULL_39_25]OGZ73294.1 MAG: hypothetical protein A3A98_00930 [Candidatus Staskawiczbacteria bacterium RIFCSPLOWO2_01_FULL_40_39]